ncbi:MAG: hypothetical protein ACLT9P_02105 [Evtepia gabavorous]
MRGRQQLVTIAWSRLRPERGLIAGEWTLSSLTDTVVWKCWKPFWKETNETCLCVQL